MKDKSDQVQYVDQSSTKQVCHKTTQQQKEDFAI